MRHAITFRNVTRYRSPVFDDILVGEVLLGRGRRGPVEVALHLGQAEAGGGGGGPDSAVGPRSLRALVQIFVGEFLAESLPAGIVR